MLKRIIKASAVTLVVFSVTACANLAPKSQVNSFSPTPLNIDSGDQAKVNDSAYDEDINSIKRSLKSTQEAFQAQQNGLIGINGRLTGMEANVQANMDIQASAIKHLNATATAQAEVLTTLTLAINNTANIVSTMENNFSALQRNIETKMESNAGRDNNSRQITSYNNPIGYVVCILASFGLIAFMWQRREIKLLKQSIKGSQVRILPLEENFKQ